MNPNRIHRHIATLACLLLLTSAAFADVTLIENGVVKCVVVTPARLMAPNQREIEPSLANRTANITEFQRQQLRAAVQDLARCLGKMSGAQVAIATDAPPANALPIYVGELAVAKYGKPGKSLAFGQGFRVVVKPDGVGLLGESDLGTNYAIYEVLDRLGCRWFMPSKWGECLPELKTVALPELDFSSAPATLYRGIWEADLDYKRRNRLGGLPLQASHALDSYVPKKVLDRHPDWVAVVNGKPSPPSIKWTKPEVADAMVATILDYFDKDFITGQPRSRRRMVSASTNRKTLNSTPAITIRYSANR